MDVTLPFPASMVPPYGPGLQGKLSLKSDLQEALLLSRAMIGNELDPNIFYCDVTLVNIKIFRRESIISQIGSHAHSLAREGKHFD